MLRWLTTQAIITCGHQGKVDNVPSQRWVTVGGAPVLVDDDPEGRTVVACPNYGATIKPCVKTLRVIRGYRSWLTIGGRRVVLSDLDGITDGTVPGTVHYSVRAPGQVLVRAEP